MKKTVIWLISILLCVLSSVSAFAQQPAEIRASSEIGSVGDTVNVSVDISGNSGMAGWMLEITWDESALKLIGDVKAGEAFAGGTLLPKHETGKLLVFWYDLKERCNDGQMLDLQFKITDAANVGDYEIKVQPSAENIVDEGGNAVAVTALSGGVHVDEATENSAGHTQETDAMPDSSGDSAVKGDLTESSGAGSSAAGETTTGADASKGSSDEVSHTNDGATQGEETVQDSNDAGIHSESGMSRIVVIALLLLAAAFVVMGILRKRHRQ